MDASILEDMGLSRGEIKVYLTLLEIGSTKVGPVIEKTHMASSAVHNSLKILIGKGLVCYIKKGKIKYYDCVSPKNLLNFIEDKKKKLLSILPELEARQKLAKEKQGAEIFEGKKGLSAMLNLAVEEAKHGDDYLFFAVTVKEVNESIQRFFRKFDEIRKAKGLIVKGLAPKGMKTLFKGRKFLKMRYPDFPIPTNISTCNDKTILFSWEEKPVGYLIESKQIAKIFRNFFNSIWEIS